MNSNRAAKDYLQQPYARIVIPDEEGGYHAEVLEFPGCYADGETPDEAYRNLEEAAESWIEVCLDKGRAIPEPSSSLAFGGNVLLRLPKSIHRQATKMAARDRTSLNQYLLAAVSARVGADDLYNRIAERLERQLVITFSTFVQAGIDAWNQDAVTPRTVDRTVSAKQIEREATTVGR